MADDKYPADSGRRRFVKGVVGSAALSGVGIGGASAVGLSTQPSGGGGGTTPYVGITLEGGPAPRGMPYIPVDIDDDGFIRGRWPDAEVVTDDGRTFTVARMELGGRTYSSEWFQYCGKQQAEGVQPEADLDTYFRAAAEPAYDWQASALSAGDPLNIAHFEDYESWGNGIGTDGVGKPAETTWRSDGEGELPVIVLRSPIVEAKAERDDAVGEWFGAAAERGIIAYLNVCTHFCCTPKGYKISEDAARFDVADGVYCQCHQSRYDPFTPEFDTFVALPRPD